MTRKYFLMTFKYTLLLVFVLAGITTSAQEKVPAEMPDTNFHIYLLMGQSNMAGRGKVEGAFLERSHERVLVLNKRKEWVGARNPLHFDKPKVAGVGPGLTFGIKMAKANPDVRIGLVPCAVGGTSINLWQAGAFDKVTKTHPYDDALVRIKEAMKTGVVKGIIWHQGESDSRPGASETWLKKLAVLVDHIRQETGNDSLACVAVELGRRSEEHLVG